MRRTVYTRGAWPWWAVVFALPFYVLWISLWLTAALFVAAWRFSMWFLALLARTVSRDVVR